MTEDPILDTVRTGLAAVQMNRPVDDIVRLGRARRRARAITAGAGVALCATLTFVALSADRGAPLAVHGQSPLAASTGPSIRPVGFTLAQNGDGTYTLDIIPGVPLDLRAVERSLGEIGITAAVDIGRLCSGKPFNGGPHSGFLRFASHPDNSASIVFDGGGFPAKATLSLALILNDRGQLVAARIALYQTGTQGGCETTNTWVTAQPR